MESSSEPLNPKFKKGYNQNEEFQNNGLKGHPIFKSLSGNLFLPIILFIITKEGKKYDQKSVIYENFIRDIIKKGGKRVHSIQKDMDRKKKQKEIMKIHEETLNRREEVLSKRFIELKERENEIIIREETLKKMEERLKVKEEGLKKLEQEIEAKKPDNVDFDEANIKENSIDKEKWMEEQRKLQAELVDIRNGAKIAEKGEKKPEISRDEMLNLKESLKKREKEIEQFKKGLKDLNSVIIKKDGEIEKLKANKLNFMVDQETKDILMVLDELLEKLPEEIVDLFARSDNYLLYEKVLDKYNI